MWYRGAWDAGDSRRIAVLFSMQPIVTDYRNAPPDISYVNLTCPPTGDLGDVSKERNISGHYCKQVVVSFRGY